MSCWYKYASIYVWFVFYLKRNRSGDGDIDEKLVSMPEPSTVTTDDRAEILIGQTSAKVAIYLSS